MNRFTRLSIYPIRVDLIAASFDLLMTKLNNKAILAQRDTKF